MNSTIDIKRIKTSAETAEMFGGKVERIGSPSLGDVVRQGDLYFICVETATGKLTNNRQLVPGETQGSRHILDGDCRVFVDGPSIAGVPKQLLGPQFRCVGDVTVEHPEHGHKIFPSATCWAVVYQRAFADEIRRAQD
jgi:hypothetical protein